MGIDISEEDRLFNKIHENGSYKFFVRDGVINKEEYDKAPVKVLYILRESYSAGGTGITDMRGFFATGGKSKSHPQTESGITRVIEQIEAASQGKILSYEETMGINNDRRKDALSKIVLFNLNKESDQDSIYTDWELLKKEVKENKDIYKELFELYQPDIIVCGGTYGLTQEVFPELENTPTKDDKYYSFISLDGKQVPVLDCYHPGARSNTQESYDRVANGLKNIYADKLSY